MPPKCLRMKPVECNNGVKRYASTRYFSWATVTFEPTNLPIYYALRDTTNLATRVMYLGTLA